MAIFTITPETSVFAGLGDDAFGLFDDSPGDDTLNVQLGAALIATSGIGAFLANTGAWTVTVNGSIFGFSYGIRLASGNVATSNITIGADGQVGGATHGIFAQESPFSLNNAGVIFGSNTGVRSTATGIQKIVNSGTITGTLASINVSDGTLNLTNSGTLNGTVQTDSGNDVVTNSGLINGDVFLDEGNNTLTNSGEITAGVLTGSGNDTITNSGTVGDAIVTGDGTNSVTNTGTVGSDVTFGTGNDTLINKGTITNDVLLNTGVNVVMNSGTISNRIFGSSGDDTITNSATIAHEVFLDAGINKLTNSGFIGDGVSGSGTNTIINSGVIDGSLDLLGGNDTVSNSGLIAGSMNLGDGTNSLSNRGTIGVDVNGGNGIDTISNAVKAGKKAIGGTITGNVDLGGDDDTFNNFIKFKVKIHGKKKVVVASGDVDGHIDLGDGNDHFNGGDKSETVMDNNGTDTVKLGNGDDVYIATGASGTDGNDIVDGGKGTDLYDASAATTVVIINLSGSVQDDAGGTFLPIIIPIDPNTAKVTGELGPTDTVTNFENAAGGSSNDVIFGSDGANLLQGNGNGDDLYGLGGNDRLEGGAGADFLVGGAGADVLVGGTEGDTFWYFDISDSGITAATRDLILDFTDDGPGGDVIDLSRIDADISTDGNQAFTFIGTNVLFSSTPGELRAYWTATGQIIEGDVNGDAKADFSIEIANPTHFNLSNLNNDDFVL